MSAKPAAAGPSVRKVPEGDTHERLVCPDCGYIQYDNPKVVVGAVCTWEDRFLLCRRDIYPRRGFWTLPAGYLELNESPADGAVRETWEEACARIDIDALLAIYHIPRISQVQLIYRARLSSADIASGPETREVRLFEWEQIPWDEIAFPTVRWALRHHREVGNGADFAVRSNPPGQSPNYS